MHRPYIRTRNAHSFSFPLLFFRFLHRAYPFFFLFFFFISFFVERSLDLTRKIQQPHYSLLAACWDIVYYSANRYLNRSKRVYAYFSWEMEKILFFERKLFRRNTMSSFFFFFTFRWSTLIIFCSSNDRQFFARVPDPTVCFSFFLVFFYFFVFLSSEDRQSTIVLTI